jgi:hypothetical protein
MPAENAREGYVRVGAGISGLLAAAEEELAKQAANGSTFEQAANDMRDHQAEPARPQQEQPSPELAPWPKYPRIGGPSKC